MSQQENKYYLYRHIRPDKNEPFYIGVGTFKPNTKNYKAEHYRAYEIKNRNEIVKSGICKESALWKALVGKHKTSNGFIWKYKKLL